MAKSKVQEIFPLTYNQKILLFHHLSTNKDSGIIQVKCTVEGSLNKESFKKAWAAVVKKYDVLRTSIQWKKLSKQLQVIQQHAELEIDWIDLEKEDNPIEFLKEYEANDVEKPFSLRKAPVSRVTVFQHNKNHYQLLWTCHHILLDGWSSRLILKDVFRYYDLAINGEELSIDSSIPSITDYLKTIKRLAQNKEPKSFWKNQIDDKVFPSRISRFYTENRAQDNFKSIEASILGSKLFNFAKEHQLTLTSLLQTAWLLTLRWFHKKNLVATGTVVSGRAIDFPDIEKLAGLLSNVIPIIHQFQPAQSFVEAAKQVQKHHAEARKYESISIDRIKEWCHWKGNPNLFDTLLVMENFVEDGIASHHLNIKNYKSGLTTTYPVTIAVVPEETIKMYCVWNEGVVDSDVANQLFYTFQEILSTNGEQKIDQIYKTLGEPPEVDITNEEKQNDRNFVVATTYTELELTKIWERILGKKTIGIKDNFFALGGKSIQALQLFREIEQSFDKTLLPSVLIQHPTIHQLSKLVNDDEEVEFNCVVPLKPNGIKAPLYCIHAGGAHVFLYKKLAESISSDYPVYGIQPKGLDGGEMHNSIEEMAQDYFKEILTITKQQKLYILGYCFSKIVCLEIARIAKEKNVDIELIIIDSARLPWFKRQSLTTPKKELMYKVGKKVLRGDWQGIANSINRNLKRVNIKFGDNTDDYFEEVGVESDSYTENHLERMSLNLHRLDDEYHWNPVKVNVHLIRSTEYANLQEKNYHVDVWEALSKNKLTTYQVNSDHKTIFEGNSVVEMAQIIEKIIDDETE